MIELTARKALREFELDVELRFARGVTVLAGPSGAGKTTLLRIVAGLTPPDEGEVRLDGRALHRDGASVPAFRREVAYVFQDYALFPHLTVRQNVAFGLMRGWLNPAPTMLEPTVERWLAKFRLEGVANHHPHQISGGQRQRTALARALVNGPRALLLDEPFAALDKALARDLRAELKELQEQLRVPLLLITHDDDDLRDLAQDVVHLRAGRVVEARPVTVSR